MTRVVKPDELDRPGESLREQMRKLELSPQEGEEMLTHSSHTQDTFCMRCIVSSDYSVNSMYTDTHRHIWALHHTCLSCCALLWS